MKKYLLSALAALLLFAQVGNVEAGYKFDRSFEYGPAAVDAAVGENGTFLLSRGNFSVKMDMAKECAEKYVKPCFQNKGIWLENIEAEAIAYALVQQYNWVRQDDEVTIYVRADGALENDDMLPLVYQNKKYLQAYKDNLAKLSEISASKLPAEKSYAEYKDNSSAEYLRQANKEIAELYEIFYLMSQYWLPGAALVLTGDYVNFRTAPSWDSEVIDSLRLNELVTPSGSQCTFDGRSWFPAINAKGQMGYVSADFVRVVL